jgi:putative toxin-antitoxin system antitoxin component (TIGR02293 family)
MAIQKPKHSRRVSEKRPRVAVSDKHFLASALYEKAVNLFEGDVAAARRWVQTPQEALGNRTPLGMASTRVGKREVENLILRLEQGVFS